VAQTRELSNWLEALAAEAEAAARAALAPVLPLPGSGTAPAVEIEVSDALEALDGLMEEFWRAFDACVGSVDFSPPMACARGCHHCCHNPISLTPAEALALGRYAERTLDPAFLKTVRARVEAALPVLHGRSREQMGEVRHLLLCPFIEGGTCMVHHARPLVCRGWNSVDASACERSVRLREPQALIENHPLPRQVADALQLGLLRGTAALHLEAGYLALPRAASLLLELGADAAAGHWLSRGPFFASRREW
jgi:Fe-S-cluster containining protein